MGQSDILNASAIVLRDRWSGMNPLAPFETHAELQRRPGMGLQGRVTFSLGYAEERREESYEVSVSEEVTGQLLAELAGVPASPGEYEPFIDHTDDFPSIHIEVATPHGALVFFTESQGEHHAPWGMKADGEDYVVDSNEPGKVLNRLREALGVERLEKMIEEVERRNADAYRREFDD